MGDGKQEPPDGKTGSLLSTEALLAVEVEALKRELAAAQQELVRQNELSGKRAAELVLATIELTHQNSEKENRATELATANRELAFQNGEKEKRAIELIAAVKDLEAFAFISSHHLQEPLRKILLRLDQFVDVKDRLFDEKEKRRFDQILGAAGQMRRLIEDLYVYSRVNVAGQEFSEVHVDGVTNEVIAVLAECIREKGARIEVDAACAISAIDAQFRLLMHHLIDNALKFGRAGVAPVILVHAEILKEAETSPDLPPAAFCRISVSDNGIGIDPLYQDRIFDVFQRLHSQEAFRGTGIGLSIVKKVVEAHKGKVRLESSADAGSVFTIDLPVRQAR